jgi:hypothetical protein
MSQRLLELSTALVRNLEATPTVNPARYAELKAWLEDPQNFAAEQEVEQARELYAGNDCQVDGGAIASRSEDSRGLWVQGWVWVP